MADAYFAIHDFAKDLTDAGFHLVSRLRNFAALDVTFNASLSSVNVAKVVIQDSYPTFSIANIKSLIYNAYIMKRFFVMSGFRPNKSSNAKIFKELLNIAAPAA